MNYLRLKVVRLKPAQQVVFDESGLLFLFLKEGNVSWQSGPNQQVLRPGEVLVARPQAGRTITAQKGTEASFWVFTLTEEHLYPLFDSSELALLHDFTSSLGSPKFFPAAHAVAAQCHRLLAEAPAQFSLDQRSYLLRVAATILGEEFKTLQKQRVGYVEVEEHLLQAFESLSAEELLTLSVEELAARFGCSRRHLNRLFHQYFGVAVAPLRMEMRLLRAVALLRDPHAKVANVAEQCGFNHQGLFNTCFRRRFGCSPTEWRKSNAKEITPSIPALQGKWTCSLRSQGLCPWLGGQIQAWPAATNSQFPTPAPVAPASPALGLNENSQLQASP